MGHSTVSAKRNAESTRESFRTEVPTLTALSVALGSVVDARLPDEG